MKKKLKINCVDIIWRWLEGISSRRLLAIVLIGLLSFIGSSLIGALSGIPQPRAHDEFSYLLAADTFSKGRLTNPTHPMWVHFESFHIIHQPTYMSKYPPGQGLILAIGQAIGGHPIWGVWLSTALMCAAICWMLYAWVPPRWAFLGGLLIALNLGIMTYWSQSYWGGAVPAIGGALVFGSLRRIIQQQNVRDALLMGLGFAILANTRPWEGMVASFPAATVLLFWISGKRRVPLRKAFTQVILPILFVLILTAIGMGIYNHKITGNALRMPYSVYTESYIRIPLFLWQDLEPEPSFRHKVMQKFRREYGIPMFLSNKSVKGIFVDLLRVPKRTMSFFFNGILIIPLIVIIIKLPWVLKNVWMRFALIACIIFAFLANVPISNNLFIHYLAPITSLIILFLVQALRLMHIFRLGYKSIGKFIVLIFLFVFIIQRGYPIAKMIDLKYLKKDKGSYFQYSIVANKVKIKRGFEYDWALKRAEIIEDLKEAGGKHLVIVRYGQNHDLHEEWVYNEADIDDATVVWAREMDMEQNRKLLEYFRDRSKWLLVVDQDNSPPQLLPYPPIKASKRK